MAEGGSKATPARNRKRFSVAVSFDTMSEHAAFKRRLEHIRSLLTPPGQLPLDNNGMMAAMFDLVEQQDTFPARARASAMQTFNRNSGKFLTKCT